MAPLRESQALRPLDLASAERRPFSGKSALDVVG